jgi:glucan 1,3-beta-glucosidase
LSLAAAEIATMVNTIDNSGEESSSGKKEWIRGVNLGGWMLLERFITPYLFAISDCDLRGEFRQFPGQIDAPALPPNLTDADAQSFYKNDVKKCKPVQPYPVDEWTLAEAFESKAVARAYLQRHWENFVTYDDLVAIKESGMDHVRVPLSHWILGGDTIYPGEPWVDGGWPHFVRVVKWCRELGLQVWPDVHTAPGSQNGFDNSGHLLEEPSGKGWSDNKEHVQRSMDVVSKLVAKIKEDGLDDVITGLGPLNEPFLDVPMDVMREFDEKTFDIVREGLNGKDTAVYIADLFNSTHWNDGFWTDPDKYSNTYLDSHYYHVFAEEPRALSPRQHIAYVCRYHTHYTTGCCYEDEEKKSIPSQGISRIIGEWSASFDTLVGDKLTDVMEEIVSINLVCPYIYVLLCETCVLYESINLKYSHCYCALTFACLGQDW